jgi:tetratricopeptide (TPR) repeat protein
MEQLFHDRLPEFYETLAYHYRQSASLLKAVIYLIKAGEKSSQRCALDESHFYFKEAYDLLSIKPDKTEHEKKILIDLIIKWGYTYHFRADFIGLINLFETHEADVASHASKDQVVMFYAWYGLALSRRDMPDKGYQYLQKALHIAEEIGDKKAIGYSCAWLTLACSDMGLLDDAIIYGKRAREIAKDYETERDLVGMALYFSGYAHYFRGDVKEIAKFGQAVLDYGNKYSDLRCIARYHLTLGTSRLSAGDYPSAINFFKNCIEVSPEPMFSFGTKLLLGMSYLVLGQLREAQTILDEVIEYSKRFGFEWAGSASQALKGMVLIAQGDLNKGMIVYENVMQVFVTNRSLYRYAASNYFMGKVFSTIAQGGGEKKDFSFLIKNIGFLIKNLPFAHKKAEEHLDIAIKMAGEIGAKSILGQAYLELGQLHKAKGKTEKASECITNAIEVFEKCEADVYLKQAREALAALG